MWSKKRLSPTESTRIRPKPPNPDAFRTTHARSPPKTAKPRRILDHQTTRPLDHEQRTTTAHGSQPYRAGNGSGGYDHHAQHPYPPFPRTQREQCTDQTTGPPQHTPTRPINDPAPRLETLVESDEDTRPVNGPEHPQAHRVLRQDLPRSAPRSAPAPDSTATPSSRKKPRKHAPLPKRNG